VKKILITFPWDADSELLQPLKFVAKLIGSKDTMLNETEILELLPEADGMIIGWERKLDEKMLNCAKNLKIIGKVGGGVGNLDTETIFRKGIILTNAAEAFAQSTAELTLALILDCLRDLSLNCQRLKMGTPWANSHGFELYKKRVGIIGSGTVVRCLAHMLHSFEVELLVYSPNLTDERAKMLGARRSNFEEIFKTCQIVSVNCALTPKTAHMIDAEHISMMASGTIFINTSRGGVVDEKALIARLKKGDIRAGLDVFETEPLPVNSELRQLDNVVITPHIGASKESFIEVKRIIFGDMLRYFQGEQPVFLLSQDKVSRMTSW